MQLLTEAQAIKSKIWNISRISLNKNLSQSDT